MKVESILNLETLKKTGKYMEYIETVKGMLCSMQVQSYTYTTPPPRQQRVHAVYRYI